MADVDYDIVNRSDQASHQLGLRPAHLVVQTAEYPGPGHGLVVLDEGCGDAKVGQGGGIVGLKKPAASIAE